jgi:hypothetical protein
LYLHYIPALTGGTRNRLSHAPALGQGATGKRKRTPFSTTTNHFNSSISTPTSTTSNFNFNFIFNYNLDDFDFDGFDSDNNNNNKIHRLFSNPPP